MNKEIQTIFSMNNKVVIITGGAGMLGIEYAKTLSGAGAMVILLDIKDKFKMPKNINGEYIKLDITDKKGVMEEVKRICKKYKRIDVLINNAALNPVPGSDESKNQFLPYENYPEELWQKELDVNLTGALFLTQAVTPDMKKQRRGSIINISSTYGINGPDNRIYENGKYKSIGYASTKGAMVNFTRAWASYLANTGIRVNALTPGGVFANQSENFVHAYIQKTILGKMADKTDYNGAILYLASDASKYMTGANLIIDGGWSAW